jgi:hypothetical protein
MTSAVDADADEPATGRGQGLHFWLAFWAVALTNLATALDATSLSVALPVRQSFFSPSTKHPACRETSPIADAGNPVMLRTGHIRFHRRKQQ